MAKRKRQWPVVSGKMLAAAMLWGTIALAQAPANHFVLQSGRGLGDAITCLLELRTYKTCKLNFFSPTRSVTHA